MKTFGSFRLDTANHCLWREDERAFLAPKAFDVLRYLVEHAGRLITQDELLEALWPDSYVNPEGIRKYILQIRKVLGDRPDQPVFIQTFPKRGYQFIADLTAETRSASPDSAELGTGRIVGRQAGISRLNSYFQKASGGDRQVAFVTGEAGIGKTTLLDTFQQHIVRDPNVRVARGQCIEGFGGKEAYYPMLEALGPLLHDAEGSTLVQTLARCAPTWLVQFPALLKPEQKGSLQREILGGTRERMVREMCEVLEAITAQRPLIVILEDLQWVDPSTLDLISAVARRRESARLLLLGTYRPVDAILSQSPLRNLKLDLVVRGLCHEIAIESLQGSDVAQYLTKVFSVEAFPAGLSDIIHQSSGGNPLFMVAIVQDMVDKGLIVKDRDRLFLTAPLQEVFPVFPETLQEMLEIQIGQLSPEEQRILECGSVAGERFSVWAAAAMLQLSPSSIDEACERLANWRQFIRAVGIHEAPDGATSSHYEFRHSLYRQALYRRLSGSSRARLHQSLAEHLVPFCTLEKPELAAELALHFEEGRNYERATNYLMIAAENATRRLSHRDSIQILEHARELIPTNAPETGVTLEIDVLQRIGDLRYALGEIADSAASYEIAAERASNAGLRTAQVEALLRLSVPVRYLDCARAEKISRDALEVSRSLSDPLLEARTALAVSSFRLIYNAWDKEDEEAFARARETVRRLSAGTAQQDVYHLYVEAIQGKHQEALEQIEVLMATSSPTVYVLVLLAKIIILARMGRFGEVLRITRAGRGMAGENVADPRTFILFEVWLRGMCFDYEGVRSLGAVIVPSNAEQHAARAAAISAVATGYGMILDGKYDDAIRCFARVRDVRVTPRFFLHWYWRLHAELGTVEARLRSGDLKGARQEADSCLESTKCVGDPAIRALAWEINSRVSSAEKDFARAREFIDKALEILDGFDIPFVGWRVHATAWDLCGYEMDYEHAGHHRERAKEIIMRLADSFEPGEPLRESLLTAPPVRRILSDSASSIVSGVVTLSHLNVTEAPPSRTAR
jgi:DNA-binding winged helix-turn-helix (wHTH) protein/tetratricopeptide (TPR) repeat protein